MEKTDVMDIAAELASGVMSNLPDNLALDATIADANVRAANLFKWEDFRVFYHGINGALKDDASWPPPADGDKIPLMKIAAKLASGVMQNLPDTMGLDPTIKDEGVRTANVMCWELFRIFYHGGRGAIADHASWPAPAGNLLSVSGSPEDGLAALGKIVPQAVAGALTGPLGVAAGVLGKVA